MIEGNTPKPTAAPPKLMKAIVSGFNVIANHIGLILFPVALDILIWLGPKLRLKAILEPILTDANRMLQAYNSQETTQLLETAQEAWALLINRINLTNSLSTFPLGIPSLLTGTDIENSPLGQSLTYEMPSLSLAFVTFLLLVAIGIVIGTVYFSFIAKSASTKPQKFSISIFGHQLINIYALLFIVIAILMIVIFPALLIISLFTLFSPALAQIVLLIITFILIWLLIPLVFSPHGIYINQQNAIKSIFTSFRLVRLFLPGTGLFLLVSIVMAQGLNILWLAAPAHSWLILVGIFGHAFIYSGLIAASFVYYQQGLDWMEERISLLAKSFKNT